MNQPTHNLKLQPMRSGDKADPSHTLGRLRNECDLVFQLQVLRCFRMKMCLKVRAIYGGVPDVVN